MANFTETELESAVTKFVKEDVNTERTDLGPLSTSYTFSEARELVASTLVFDPSAIFYLLSLAANRVNQDVIQALDYLDDIIIAIDEVGGDTTTVTQTSLLEDAAAALIEVERTIEDRNAIAARPFDRYTQALDVFTNNSLTPNVRRLGPGFPDTYEIVRPPQQAQSSIKTNIAELRDLHVVLLAEASQLTEALSEFLEANLPLASIQNTVPKVRNDLRSIKSAFDAATRDGAIEITRDAFLSIQAGRAVITNLTSISDPREARMASSATSSDRAEASYPCSSSTPAEVSSEKGAPFYLTDTTNLAYVKVDGSVVQVATIDVPERGILVGYVGETFDIHDAGAAEMTSGSAGPYTVPASPDNVFDVYVDGVGYRATLTSGSRTAAQVAAEVNAATLIAGGPGTFDDVATASDDAGSLKLSHDTAGENTLILGDAAALNVALGFTNEQEAVGQDANNELRLVTQDSVSTTVSLTNGLARTAAQGAAGSSASPYFEGGTETLETDSGTIEVVTITSSVFGEDSQLKIESLTATQESAVETLGFSEGQEDRGEYASLRSIKNALDTVSGIEVELTEETLQSGNGGTAVDDGGSPKLRLPWGTITASPTDSDTLRITNGANIGWYLISAVSLGGAYDEITVTRPFPVMTGVEAQNQQWELHRDRFTIRSLSMDVDSQIEVEDGVDSGHVYLGLPTAPVIGSVSGVKIKEGTKLLNFTREDVVAGDILTFSGPTYTTEHTVTAVTYDGYQVEVTPEVPGDLSGHEYTVEGSGARAYDQFIQQLLDWFTDVLEPSRYTTNILELERTLNPLLVNKNPSAALIGTARTAANNLRNVYSQTSPYLGLTEILAGFTTLVVPRIDALLDMLRERGLDRAHDLLLLGEFTEFFSAGKDGSSYGGNLLEKMRSIAQNDVPQGRGTEFENADDRLLGSYAGTDSEYDFSDQDDETGIPEIDDVPDLDEDADVVNRSL